MIKKTIGLKAGKYTSLQKQRHKDVYIHSFMVRFSEDPRKIFGSEYFKINTVEHDSLYSIVPAKADEPGAHPIWKSPTAVSYPFYSNFTSVKGIDKIARFGSIEVESEMTDNAIEFMLPEQRNLPREVNRGAKRRTKVVPRKVSKAKMEKVSDIVSTTVTDVSKQIRTLNDLVLALAQNGTTVTLRVEGNSIRASVKTEIDL